MKKIFISLIVSISLLMTLSIAWADGAAPATAQTAPAISTPAPATPPATAPVTTPASNSILNGVGIDGYALYNLNTKTMQLAPGVTYPLFSLLNGAFIGNIGAVVPVSNTQGSTNLKIGPVVTVVLNKLVANISGVQWLAPQGVEIGGGILLDAVGACQTGATIKTVAFPALYLKVFTF
jgi:hypothetical protein